MNNKHLLTLLSLQLLTLSPLASNPFQRMMDELANEFQALGEFSDRFVNKLSTSFSNHKSLYYTVEESPESYVYKVDLPSQVTKENIKVHSIQESNQLLIEVKVEGKEHITITEEEGRTIKNIYRENAHESRQIIPLPLDTDFSQKVKAQFKKGGEENSTNQLVVTVFRKAKPSAITIEEIIEDITEA